MISHNCYSFQASYVICYVFPLRPHLLQDLRSRPSARLPGRLFFPPRWPPVQERPKTPGVQRRRRRRRYRAASPCSAVRDHRRTCPWATGSRRQEPLRRHRHSRGGRAEGRGDHVSFPTGLRWRQVPSSSTPPLRLESQRSELRERQGPPPDPSALSDVQGGVGERHGGER